jgi:hypothetical protein
MGSRTDQAVAALIAKGEAGSTAVFERVRELIAENQRLAEALRETTYLSTTEAVKEAVLAERERCVALVVAPARLMKADRAARPRRLIESIGFGQFFVDGDRKDLRGGGVSSVFDTQAGSINYAASVPGTALVWARRCLGLFETVCSFDLHRVTLPAGEDQIVAVADSAAPVALSASGHRFAIAARDGIYVRDLP